MSLSPHSSLEASYRRCEEIARASNFYGGLRLLPRGKRRALSAIYAFMRHCDDISDNEGTPEEKKRKFASARDWLERANRGESMDHPVLPALRDTIRTYRIPIEYFRQLILGTEMDLTRSSFQTFEELSRYCYHVASIVGLICIHVFGFRRAQAKEHAVACGIAFQLTNILRDVAEDLERNRVYLPMEDLRRFRYTREDLSRKVMDDRFRALMAFEVQRAQDYYRQARPLLKMIERNSRPAFWAMLESYHTLLRRIERCGYAVLNQRVKLTAGDKWRIAFASLLHW